MIFAHGPAAPVPSFPGVLWHWSAPVPVVVMLVPTACLYIAAARSVRRSHEANPFPPGRQVAFLAGLGVVAVALMSPVDEYSTTLLSVHMVQHVLLVFVAAPLLLAGAPVTLALRAAPPGLRRRFLHPLLESRALRLFTHPLVSWLLFATVMWGTHFSGLFGKALDDPFVHGLEHAIFLVSALLFFLPVLGIDPGARRMPHPARALYMFLGMPQNTFLSVAILSAGRVLYPHYEGVPRSWGPTPLQDQRTAAGIMWVAGDLALLAGVIVVMAMWARHEERMAEIIDAQLATGDLKAPSQTSTSTAIEANRAPR